MAHAGNGKPNRQWASGPVMFGECRNGCVGFRVTVEDLGFSVLGLWLRI